jgi:hypothetical protein
MACDKAQDPHLPKSSLRYPVGFPLLCLVAGRDSDRSRKTGTDKADRNRFWQFCQLGSSIRRLQGGNGEANNLLTICPSRVQAVERPSVAAAASKLCGLGSAGIAPGHSWRTKFLKTGRHFATFGV